MRVGLDVDDVLYSWFDNAHRLCERAGITNGVMPTTWRPYEEYGVDLEAWLEVMDAVTLSGELYAGDPEPGVVKQAWRLVGAGHEVHYVTARGFFRHGDIIRSMTRGWLVEHGFPCHSLTFTKDKTIVPLDYFLDDNLDNWESLTAHGVEAYLLDRPWNQESCCDDYRVFSVEEYVDIILKEEP